MSVTIILFIVGIIVSIVRKAMAQKQQEQPRRAPMPQRTTSEPKQSAWDWMHSQEAEKEDPEGETQMYRDMPEEWIHPVEASVQMDLSELQESQHEVVRVTVHDSLHHRRDEVAETKGATGQKRNKIALNSSNLAQALILSEVLGEPRSKRPWNPRDKR